MRYCLIGGGTNTNEFLETAIEAQGTERQHVLIIPSACSTTNSYDNKVSATIARFEQLGVTATVLHEFNKAPSPAKLDDSFGEASVLYIIGGNSPYFYDTVQSHESDKKIHQAIAEGKLLSGTSAGALAPFEIAHINPAKRPAEEAWDFALQPMLGIIKAAATAHANQFDKRPGNQLNDSNRLQDFSERFMQTGLSLGFAIDNNAAIHVTPDSVEVLSNSSASTVHVLRLIEETVEVIPCAEPGQLAELAGDIFSKVAL